MQDDDFNVTIDHLYSVPNFKGSIGFCAPVARLWCKQHGIDWHDFVHNGISAQRLIDTGDAFALRLVEHARSVHRG